MTDPRSELDSIDPEHTYERLECEDAEAFHAFTLYRDGGHSRSIVRVAEALNADHIKMRDTAAYYLWEERCINYDRHLDAERRAAAQRAVEAMVERHMQTFATLSQVLLAPVQELGRRIVQARSEGRDPYRDISTADLARYAALVSRAYPAIVTAERTTHGLDQTGATQRTQPDPTADHVRQLTDTDLDHLLAPATNTPPPRLLGSPETPSTAPTRDTNSPGDGFPA